MKKLYFNRNGDFTEYVLRTPIFMHEYGHYIDSQKFGVTYLLNIGIPSLISAMDNTREDNGIYSHNYRWYERNANKNAERYFNKHYGNRIIWNENRYPIRRRNN
ncbi:MAG: hypothetical protein Q3983_05615 [Capnocytophaga sp.]|nr:hypothetical protein [Capnocytophaga sp.]